MTDHEKNALDVLRDLLSYIAALLGIGTFAGLVNIGVGLLSGCWLAYQLYVSIKYELPLKRARLAAAQRGQVPSTKPGDLT
jgi:hypothetical protein